jgi:ADP-ribose pyrophosphatase YjhB (NUDIX family)
MKTVLMAIAVVKDGDQLLLRKTDPNRNPYREPWALVGGRLEGDGTVTELLNQELSERWNFTVSIAERLWWDEDIKTDHDGEEKRFIYIDALCVLAGGEPQPVNQNEEIVWVNVDQLSDYELNPPTAVLLKRRGYLS